MSQSWNIDPTIGDYINSSGAPEQTDSLQVPAYFRIKIKRTRWLYAPNDKFGSDFYTVMKRPSDNGNKKMEDIARNALQPLLDDGRAQQVDAKVTQNVRGGTALTVTIKDASGEVVKQTLPAIGL